jgi:hypothetical protein
VSLSYFLILGDTMSFEVFVIIVIVAIWASLPLSLIKAVKDMDDELQSDEHH